MKNKVLKKMGKKGGLATLKKYGPRYFSELSKKRWSNKNMSEENKTVEQEVTPATDEAKVPEVPAQEVPQTPAPEEVK